MTHTVPKIIWQTHNYEIENLPDHLKKIKETWELINPNWEYRYVSHSQREETVKRYPIFWQYYSNQTPICQADIWRYLVTYEYGGVYADMDSICVKPIDYMLDEIEDAEIFVVPQFLWKNYNNIYNMAKNYKYDIPNYPLNALEQFNGYGTNNANFAVKKHSKIMKEIIEESQIHLVESSKNKINHITLLRPFMDVIIRSNNVSYKFDVALHDDVYKAGFDSDFAVDDYGVMVTYEEYMKNRKISQIEPPVTVGMNLTTI